MTNNFIKGMIVGILLGNSLFQTSKGNDKRLCIGHSEKQLEYLKYKVEIINYYLSTNIKINKYVFRTEYSSEISLPFYRYYSKYHHKITHFYNLMCDENGNKRIPKKVLNKYFNDVSLSFLFMDNGIKETKWNCGHTKKKIHNFKICLDKFSVEDVEILNNFINEKFQLNGKIYLVKSKYPYIKYTTEENRNKFLRIIEPYIIPSMKYKIMI